MDSKRIRWTSALLVALALAASGCSDGDGDVPQKPQINPHINPINACQLWLGDGTYPAQHWTFDLLLYNFGREILNVDGFEVRHDRNCAFAPPDGTVRLFDNDPDDDFAATARLNDAAIMRIEYTPQVEDVDEIEIVVHSNAENFPDLSLYVCAAGTTSTTLSCAIRVDPACTASGTACLSDADCPSEETCIQTSLDEPDGTCQCRPCGLPPEDSWADCPAD